MNNKEILFVIVTLVSVLFLLYWYFKMLKKIMDKKNTKEKIHSWKDKKVITQYKSSTRSSIIVTCVCFGGPLAYFLFRENFAKKALLIQHELIERNLPHGPSGWEPLNEKIRSKLM
ncbi:hypothetical protein [Carnobacterium maltaromaticum]|uniref:hypothetical protein n=1 Tax=Carnobacterium maltaromaticum TaxID=2751 RepID=UPI00191B9181|nr:hypothetical protein [Carnobacterium maltaromaticum]CAD5902683.1 hypothetical protein CMALT394_500002 [Carnobacterium maltaromaticum]